MAEPHVTQWADAPQPSTHESPCLHITSRDLFVSYLITPVALTNKDKEECAVVKFSGFSVLSYGYPNDEALPGNPLYKYGLKYYSFNVVENSPRIEEMKRQNAVCFPGSEWLWDNIKHFIVTFQDETLEVVCKEVIILGRFPTNEAKKALEQCLSERCK